jgi:AraC-like DNA-binding protein
MSPDDHIRIMRHISQSERHFCELQPRLLVHDFVHLETWSSADFSAPHWRLYWNPAPGASVTFRGATQALAPSHLFLIPPGTAFAARLARPVQHFYVHFTLGQAYAGVAPQVLAVRRTAAHTRRLARIRALAAQGRLGRPAGTLAVLALVTDLLAQLPESAWEAPRPDRRIGRVLDWIEARGFASPPGNRDLARVAGLSTNAFIRLFTAALGQPPMRYLAGRRMDHAAILLQHSEQTIEEIAAACGCCDRYHFSRLFRARHGLGPARYRRSRRYNTCR